MQAVQAAQVTVEDYAMSHVGLAPLQVVGYEGVLGCIALAILLTIVYYIPGAEGEGLHEDSLDSIHMVLLLPELIHRRHKYCRMPGLCYVYAAVLPKLRLCACDRSPILSRPGPFQRC